LVQAIKELFGAEDHPVQAIGVRHGEKLYESLLSTEERATAIDHDGYFQVPLDTRSLDYSLYFDEGAKRPAKLEAYTSHNTARLDVEAVKNLLLTLPEVQAGL
jgi:UDP-glucose 4-epimerase